MIRLEINEDLGPEFVNKVMHDNMLGEHQDVPLDEFNEDESNVVGMIQGNTWTLMMVAGLDDVEIIFYTSDEALAADIKTKYC